MNINIILKSLIRLLLVLIIGTIILTSLNYFNIINEKVLICANIILMLISTFVGGYYLGINIKEKGAINGLILVIVVLLTCVLIGLIFKEKIFSIKSIIYKFIIGFFTFASMILGMKKQKNKG